MNALFDASHPPAARLLAMLNACGIAFQPQRPDLRLLRAAILATCCPEAGARLSTIPHGSPARHPPHSAPGHAHRAQGPASEADVCRQAAAVAWAWAAVRRVGKATTKCDGTTAPKLAAAVRNLVAAATGWPDALDPDVSCALDVLDSSLCAIFSGAASIDEAGNVTLERAAA